MTDSVLVSMKGEKRIFLSVLLYDDVIFPVVMVYEEKGDEKNKKGLWIKCNQDPTRYLITKLITQLMGSSFTMPLFSQ